jgi:hypothetical protein
MSDGRAPRSVFARIQTAARVELVDHRPIIGADGRFFDSDVPAKSGNEHSRLNRYRLAGDWLANFRGAGAAYSAAKDKSKETPKKAPR